MEQIALDDVQNGFSNSSDSHSISNLSILEGDATLDSFQRRLIQHARDKKRMDSAVAGDAVRVTAFSKARFRPRVAVTMNRVENNTGALFGSDAESSDGRQELRNELQAATRQKPHAQWATKGRQRNDYLKRVNSDGPVEGLEPEWPRNDPDLIYPRRTAFTGDSPRSDIDWNGTAADNPSSSTEAGSPNRRRASPLYGSLRRRASQRLSLERIIETEPDRRRERDRRVAETARSRLDFQKQREQEIEEVRRGAIATNKLAEIEQNLPTRSSSYSESLRKTDNAPLQQRLGLRKGSDGSEIESGNPNPSVFSLRQAKGSAVPDQHSSRQRPDHRRPGSRDLLRKLARASSSTPSPTGLREEWVSHETHPSQDQVMGGTGYDAPQRLLTPPDDEPLAQSLSNLNPNTPVVTGAWLATPAPTNPPTTFRTSDGNEKPSIRESGNNAALTGRPGPKSAFKAVIQNEGEAGYGDSALASLKDLSGHDDLPNLSLDDETLQLVNNVNVRVDQGQTLREEEKQLVFRMGGLLRTARVGVRDASKGLRRVERQVEQADAHGVQRHATHEACAQCNAAASISLSSLLSGAFASFRDRFLSRTRKGSVHLTWLGTVCLILAFWSMAEITLW